MEILEHSNHRWGYLEPVWKELYKELDYKNEPFNDSESLSEWKELGYTQTKFTGDMYDMRNPEPIWMAGIRQLVPWKYFSWSVYRMGPGCVLPTHGDTYARFREIYNHDGDIYRAVFFMEDWQSGHYFEIDSIPKTNWRAGDYVYWKNDTTHLAANVGRTDRYTLQITGIIE
jgi:hypothetical protein